MGQSVSFLPVPAGLCCKSIDYGAIQPQFILSAVSAISSRRYPGLTCSNYSRVTSSMSNRYHSAMNAGVTSFAGKGGVRHVI
ncbi:hypothetical protein [Pectobacterium sp. B1J-3]|uniref:hypothetical protein n=1 Tax=Pectobacterium sp. B1J-3 TaxID=3385371 RepID=UPI0039066CD7